MMQKISKAELAARLEARVECADKSGIRRIAKAYPKPLP